MSEFSQILRIMEELKCRQDAQKLELEILREHVAELTEQLHGNTAQPEDKAA
ncbi:hypothetical protein [Microbulbifer sp. HZ11]|uniref:hypothetical protein n=1 Tax=Microbulbifer sp. HZ11 TaxID=1453501 RepID=UPI000AF503A6|nr:hypothetical protein [Microbulbifer sp. HZ11]